MEQPKLQNLGDTLKYDVDDDAGVSEIINESGHVQELDRQFGLLSICSIGITTGNVWAALGGSIVIALYNGGPPGVIYEFIAVSVFYWLIAACIADMASSIPSSAGVYQWASVTGGVKYGRAIGFFAGWWNCIAWIFGTASISSILANQVISMYGLFHPDYAYQRWHVFVAYLLITWACCFVVMFANRALPTITNIGLFLILAGCFISIMVCAIMPSRTDKGHASSEFVWKEWQNQTGWDSDGFVFLAGMLNGAFAVGTPDCVSHLAEELPRPRANIPKAILAQYAVGCTLAFLYVITIFYSVNDLDALVSSPWSFPLAELYRQSTGSIGGSMGLLLVIFLPMVSTNIGCYITCGRMLWTMGRDKASPFSNWIGHIDERYHNPLNATLVCGIVNTVMGAIYVGSTTAFSAFIGSFIVLGAASYLGFIVPNLVTRRRNVAPGPFSMPDPVYYVVAGLACAYMLVFIVIYCFPYAKPFDAASMNYSSLITGGLTIFVGAWWFWIKDKGYVGPGAIILEGTERPLTDNGGKINNAEKQKE